ncbi:MAG: nucleotidyltransferase domain-containing protein [Thiotrichales bacterium]
MLTETDIEQAAQRVAQAARDLVKIIVFGSYARGDATELSDLDLLVVEKDADDFTNEYVRLRNAIGSVGVGVDLLLVPEAEFEKRRHWSSTPVYWAVREGRVLYDAAA